MSIDEKSSINNQKREIFEQEHHVSLKSACSIGNGIIKIDGEAKNDAINLFDSVQPDLTFFIPASGSGSRMFTFLFDFSVDGIETEHIKTFFNRLEDFAFYKTIPLTVREKMSSLQREYVAEYLLNQEGMQFAHLPKGLIPFHEVGDRIYNPFQEQVLQGKKLMSSQGTMHFTVQEGFEKLVQDSIDALGEEVCSGIDFSYSNQDKETDAYCFNLDGSPFVLHDKQLRRPAGHGALIANLNATEGDLVLIKNIDNVQHLDKCRRSNDTWKLATGLLIQFKEELKSLSEDYSIESLRRLNSKYDFLSAEEVENINESKMKEIASRPSRVCGMVLNEGAPGGGPFWINDNGTVTKQIIEGVQISKEADQQEILQSSSHFNPVFVALSKTDVYGNKLDLNDFVDSSKNLVVKKPHNGQNITYRELPGLWNGAMSDWNTIFLEIPAEVFSPVKTALDLLSDAHQA